MYKHLHSINDEPLKTSEITESDSRKVPDPEKGPVSSQDPLREATSGSSQDPVQERSAEAPVLDNHNHSESSVKAKPPSLLPAESKTAFTHFYLIILQICLFLGIEATGVGYIGCFTVIQNTASTKNTYLWVGLEAILAFLRIILWGWNPEWDEAATGVAVKISLTTTEPLITTPVPYNKSFDRLMVVDDVRFLNHLTPYTGPLERFNGSDHNVAIYYTLVGMGWTKVLLTTVLDLKTRSTFVLEHHSGSSKSKPHVYSASFEVLQETGIPVVTFKTTDTLDKLQQSKRKDLVHSIEKHSRQLIVHIAGGEKHVGEDRNDPVSHLYLSWTISHQNTSNPPILQSSPLSQIAACIRQFLDVLVHHPALPAPAPTTEPQPQIAVLTDADKQYMDWNKNVCQAKIEACDHSAEVYETVIKALAREMMADLAGDSVPEQHAKSFTYTCSFLEMLAHHESAVLEVWVLLEYQKLASNIPMHSDIFADAWSVGLANRRKNRKDAADQRISEYKKLPLISPDALMPQGIQRSIKNFVSSIHVDDHSITLPDTGNIAQQLQYLREYDVMSMLRDMNMERNMDMDIVMKIGMFMNMDVDMDNMEMDIMFKFLSHQKHEMAQMIDRVMHVFQEGINLENQPSMKLALAEYVMYPEKGSDRDGVELMQIMLRRQLSVYDCEGMSDSLIDFLPQLGDVPGASLIKVAPALRDQVVHFIDTHPEIPIFSITLYEKEISEHLRDLLQRNRLSLAEQCDNAKADVTSFLCFESKFTPAGTSMQCWRNGHAMLMVHVAKAGALQLTFWHRALLGNVVLSLSLLTFGLDFTSLSPGKTTPLPQLKIKPSDGFQSDTVEIMVEPGYHEISIDVEASSLYNLCRITAAFAAGSDENPGQDSKVNDELSEKDDEPED
ncbi:hypothetical protein C8J56DRAFT_506614 [Mycena floridula]|nr:hypothetical protein C8J56DRAFT_506614 [Mycena floridula]